MENEISSLVDASAKKNIYLCWEINIYDHMTDSDAIKLSKSPSYIKLQDANINNPALWNLKLESYLVLNNIISYNHITAT